MYRGFLDKETKSNYRKILDATIALVKQRYELTQLPLYNNIYVQLLDIKENVVMSSNFVNPDEIDERYSIGAIATKNFSEDGEMQERLYDIFSGACDYNILLE